MILAIIVVVVLAVVGRAFYVQVLQHDFLASEGNKRQIRTMDIPAPRGEIFDRQGALLALSTPVAMVWADPKILNRHLDRIPDLSRALGVSAESLRLKVQAYANKRFLYLKRRALPQLAERLERLDVPGVYVEEAYKRYYPAGSITAHVVGFTNIDERGQDGVEYTYNDWLMGVPGKKQVIKDRAGHVIEFVKDIQPAQPGKPITLSIDKDIQYFTYRALKKAMIKHQASSASAVVLSAKTGEILAMVSQPSYNPNDRSQLKGAALRNRVITDVMEPGSTVKPFIVAQGLNLGIIDESTQINTAPGYFKVEDRTISDTHNHGTITPAQVIEYSSNIGVSKIALKMTPEQEWSMYHELGFGQDSGLFLPGEVPGRLRPFQAWGPVEQASASYGYGFNVTLLQLAHAYLLFANEGAMLPVSLIKQSPETVASHAQPIIRPEIAKKVLHMMEAVTSREGTAPKAAIPGYRVAGKTGTVHKTKAGGYEENEYLSLFAGVVPASNPDMVMAVVVNKPSRGVYYGGQVAAPIFKEVMQEALRLRHVPYDAVTDKGKSQ
jgi:cell division protein FtsI (penicillin-binding protein 3)